MMNDNNNQNQPTDGAISIYEILGLFSTLNKPTQEIVMNVLRLADSIRKSGLPDDVREPVLQIFDAAFDAAAAGKGVLT